MIELGEMRLRRLEPGDLEALYIYRNGAELRSQLSHLSRGYSRADLASWLDWHAKQKDEVLLAITDTETDHCIGHVGLYQIDHRVGKAEFGILIGDERWRSRGIGQKVSTAVFDWGFAELNLRRIWIEILANNPRSIRAYEKLGFELEGTLRQHEYRGGAYVDCLLMGLMRSA